MIKQRKNKNNFLNAYNARKHIELINALNKNINILFSSLRWKTPKEEEGSDTLRKL